MVVIRPVSMPKPSLSRTWTTGARQLVVQHALLTMVCLAGSYSFSLTPMTMVLIFLVAPLPGAERMTFLAPAARWPLAFSFGEEAGGFDHVINAQGLPRKLPRLLGGHDALDLVAVDHESVVLFLGGVALLGLDLVLELAMHRVVLHLVGEVVGVGGDINHRHDVDFLAQQALVAEGLENHPADAAETVDAYL